MTNNAQYYSFRTRETSEIIAIVNMHDHMRDHIRSRLRNEESYLPRSNIFYLKCAYEISPVTKAEKETYCDAFGVVPVYDITDLAIISINWLTVTGNIVYQEISIHE